MKRVLLATLLAALTGCGPTEPKPMVLSSDGRTAYAKYDGIIDTFCNDGVVYIRIGGYNNMSWGGPKFGPDSKVITCGMKP